MLFAVTCLDRPQSLALRLTNRPAHLEYVKATGVVMAGPLLAEDGETPMGSLLLIEADSRAAAEIWAAGDPYAKAGLFESVIIRPFRRVIG